MIAADVVSSTVGQEKSPDGNQGFDIICSIFSYAYWFSR